VASATRPGLAQVAGLEVADPAPGKLPVAAEGQVGGAEDEVRRLRQLAELQLAKEAPVAALEQAHARRRPQPVDRRGREHREAAQVARRHGAKGFEHLGAEIAAPAPFVEVLAASSRSAR
jgi:hypothetical protein